MTRWHHWVKSRHGPNMQINPRQMPYTMKWPKPDIFSILEAILNYTNCSMMPALHHSVLINTWPNDANYFMCNTIDYKKCPNISGSHLGRHLELCKLLNESGIIQFQSLHDPRKQRRQQQFYRPQNRVQPNNGIIN